jgi:hypothetical protein
MPSAARQLQLSNGAITPTPAIVMIENPRFSTIASTSVSQESWGR